MKLAASFVFLRAKDAMPRRRKFPGELFRRGVRESRCLACNSFALALFALTARL